jgi:hypothetical protein
MLMQLPGDTTNVTPTETRLHFNNQLCLSHVSATVHAIVHVGACDIHKFVVLFPKLGPHECIHKNLGHSSLFN